MASDDLRARLETALRAAAFDCPGDCGQTETECLERHPIQVEVLHFDQVATIAGPVEALADVVIAVVQPELDRLAEVRRFCELSKDSMRVPVAEMARDILRYLDTGHWTVHAANKPVIDPVYPNTTTEESR